MVRIVEASKDVASARSPITIACVGFESAVSACEVRDFLDREWATEDVLRFGRYEPGMWEERHGTLAAYQDDEVVGVAVFTIQAGVGKLNQLIVAADHRGKGVGSALLAEFERICREAGCHKVTLKTFWRMDPLHFYQRRGYVVEGVLRRDLRGVDMCQVAKFLTT